LNSARHVCTFADISQVLKKLTLSRDESRSLFADSWRSFRSSRCYSPDSWRICAFAWDL